MTQIETIIAEIERRMEKNQQDATESGAGAFYEDRQLLSFIKSLPAEQPSEDLEISIIEFLGHIPENEPEHSETLYTYEQMQEIARHFAQWQKQQMMRSAIDGCYIKRNKYTKENVLNGLSVTCNAIQKFKDGDKVKVIIAKEDEQCSSEH